MKKEMKNSTIKKENGAIAVFVLVALLFMSAFLIISFASNVNKGKDVQDQLNIASDIYTYSQGEGGAYNKAYKELRDKNKKTMQATSVPGSSNLVELQKTFAENIINYKIYGASAKVGDLVTSADENNGKYKITIKVSNSSNETKTVDIYLSQPLANENDYIEFKTKKVVRTDGTEENVDLPELTAYEDYTKIEVSTTIPATKVEVEYEGYTIE